MIIDNAPKGSLRAEISGYSLWEAESGNSAVALGIYVAVLHVLGGMDKDIFLIAQDDKLGRQIAYIKYAF